MVGLLLALNKVKRNTHRHFKFPLRKLSKATFQLLHVSSNTTIFIKLQLFYNRIIGRMSDLDWFHSIKRNGNIFHKCDLRMTHCLVSKAEACQILNKVQQDQDQQFCLHIK